MDFIKIIDKCERLLHLGENVKRNCVSRFEKTEIAKKNKELKNKRTNKRCFIIGNGLSIKTQDLSLLAEEDVFVVNEFWRYEKCQEVCPNYYLIFDPIYFETNGKDLSFPLLDGINKIQTYPNKPIFILPRMAEKTIHNCYHWDEWTSVYYIDPKLNFIDGYRKEYDLAKPVPSVQNVVQYAILIATYMGYKEIYILGIEQTNILDNIEAYLGKSVSRYAFDYGDQHSKSIVNEALTMQPLESLLKSYAKIFHLYKEVYLFCQRRGIQVYNCTPESLVDSIPLCDYYSLFTNKER